MPNYVTVRRWALRPGRSQEELLQFVATDLVPTWKRIPGCLSLNLLAVRDSDAYLAVTYWESREAFDTWSGSGGQQWRDAHREVLSRWLELMVFQDEMDADLLIVG